MSFLKSPMKSIEKFKNFNIRHLTIIIDGPDKISDKFTAVYLILKLLSNNLTTLEVRIDENHLDNKRDLT